MKITRREVDAFIRWYEKSDMPSAYDRLRDAYSRLANVLSVGIPKKNPDGTYNNDCHLFAADDILLKGAAGKSILDIYLGAGVDGFRALSYAYFLPNVIAEAYAKADPDVRMRFENAETEPDCFWKSDYIVLGNLYTALARGDDPRTVTRRALIDISDENIVWNIKDILEKFNLSFNYDDFLELDEDGYPFALRVAEAHDYESEFMCDLRMQSAFQAWKAAGKNPREFHSFDFTDLIFDQRNPNGLGKYKYTHAARLPKEGLRPLPHLSALDIAPGPYAVMRMIYGVGCNMDCGHCSTNSPRENHRCDTSKFLSLSQRLLSIKLFHGLGLKTLIINGKGEPLMQPDVPKFAAVLRGMGINPVIATNGTLLTDKLCEQLNAANTTLVLKLHSMNPEKSDEISGQKGAYQKFMNAFDIAIRHGFARDKRLALDCPITKSTAPEMAGVLRFCLEHDIVPWFDEGIPIGRLKQKGCATFKELRDTHFQMAATARKFGYRLDIGNGHFFAGAPWINFDFIQLTNRGKALLVPRFGQRIQLDKYPFDIKKFSSHQK